MHSGGSMTEEVRSFEERLDSEGWLIKDLWEKYEDIAMHFNDLLIRLRTQALAGVAAISTIVSIFARSGSDLRMSWEVAVGVFFFLCLFWIAIWIVDFRYYNKLLIGAVAALMALEEASKTQSRVRHINMSTMIEKAVACELPGPAKRRRLKLAIGCWAFYVIVFLALILGLCFSYNEYREQGRVQTHTVASDQDS
jgi:hypothetical protein